MDGHFLMTLQGLHEATVYRIRGKEGFSEEWLLERGLREKCPSSPPLFNIHHQAVMRIARKERERKAVESGKTAGIVFWWVPSSSFLSPQGWEEEDNSEAINVVVEKSIFADDATVVGYEDELEEGVQATTEVMGWFEERNNDGKEERLMFGEEESCSIRMLGSWMGWAEDIKQRLKRGGRSWLIAKQRLKGSKLPKKVQARVVEASVESSVLFDCPARTWRVKEIQWLQSLVDRAYRYIWSNKKKLPLVQIQQEGVNMVDVREALGVKSLRWKIEKQVYESIGHVLRMEDGRLVKALVFGWLKNLGKSENAGQEKEDGAVLEESDQGGGMGCHDDQQAGGGQKSVERDGPRKDEAFGRLQKEQGEEVGRQCGHQETSPGDGIYVCLQCVQKSVKVKRGADSA